MSTTERPGAWGRAWLPLGLVTFACGVLVMHVTGGYTSDSVAVQVVLGQWLRGYHDTAWLGVDNFLLKLPVYLLTEYTLPHSRLTLLLTDLLFAAAGLFLFWRAARYFVARYAPGGRPALGPAVLWLTTLSTAFLAMFFIPNLRNVEIGLSFFIVAQVLRHLEGDAEVSGRPGRVVVAAAVVGCGFFLYNDPYFLYTAAVPLMIALGHRWWTDGSRRAVVLLGLVGGSVLAHRAWQAVLEHLNVRVFGPPPSFVPFDRFPETAGLFVQGVLRIFHADFFGRDVGRPGTVITLVNAALLGLLLLFAAAWARRHLRSAPTGPVFVLAQIVVASAAYVFSNYSTDTGTHRYLVVLPFDLVLVACLAHDRLARRGRVVLVGLLVVAFAGNTLSLGRALASRPRPGNTANQVLIEAVRGQGLEKGYADYWSGNINTFLSGNEIDFIPVFCPEGGYVPYRWLIDDAILDKPATRTFFVEDPKSQIGKGCPAATAATQFGPPAATVPLGDGRRLLVYDHDIGSTLR